MACEVRDVTVPKAREELGQSSAVEKRILRVSLTDGHHFTSAIDFGSVAGLRWIPLPLPPRLPHASPSLAARRRCRGPRWR